mgnify:FL=1
MERFGRLAVLLVAALAAGCAGATRVTQDYAPDIDFAHLQTYSWRPGAGGESSDMNVLLAARIRAALERGLAEKGLRSAGHGRADIYVDFRYRIQRGYESTGISTGFGLGSGRGGTFGGIGIGMGDFGGAYDEAVLTIDFLDYASGTLVWQGSGRRRALTHGDPEQSTREINETVKRILARFPPGNK